MANGICRDDVGGENISSQPNFYKFLHRIENILKVTYVYVGPTIRCVDREIQSITIRRRQQKTHRFLDVNLYAFHLRPRGSNGTVAVRLIVVVWPVRSMHRAAVLVLLAGETSLSGSP